MFDTDRNASHPFRGVVRKLAEAARDVLLFYPGVVHTFSAPDEDLVLLSYHAPFVELDDPRQYTLPPVIWKPIDHNLSTRVIGCDPAWTLLAHCGGY